MGKARMLMACCVGDILIKIVSGATDAGHLLAFQFKYQC